jgi:uncharacterized surface protein with fasciclin (FAS1) repeats
MKYSYILFHLIAATITGINARNHGCESIVDIAVGNEDFSTLVAALTAADLVDTLSGDGPFTVFAPTNDAFAELDAKTLAFLLQRENKSTLANILLYHVVAGKVLSTDLEDYSRVTTLQGTTVLVRTDPVRINQAFVTTADIIACNGVIHVIDAVLLPKNTPPPPASKPHIKKVGQCNPNSTCGLCEGDCDSDDDCEDGFVCFHRRKRSFQKVPGCRGGGSDNSGTDYCIDPNEL